MIELRASKQNPNHLSVGLVIIKDQKVALIKRKDWFLLPAETVYLGESLLAALKRGAAEELGLVIEVKVYLGSTKSVYGDNYQKTTVYFLCEAIDTIDPHPDDYELEDAIYWEDMNTAISKLKGNQLGESELLSNNLNLINAEK